MSILTNMTPAQKSARTKANNKAIKALSGPTAAPAVEVVASEPQSVLGTPVRLEIASTRTIRVWGIEPLVQHIDALATAMLVEVDNAGLVRQDGSAYRNFVHAPSPHDYKALEATLGFWGRLSTKALAVSDAPSCRKMAEVVKAMDGFTPKGMAIALSIMLDIPVLEAQQALVKYALENRKLNEELVLTQCKEQNSRTPYEFLAQYDTYRTRKQNQQRQYSTQYNYAR